MWAGCLLSGCQAKRTGDLQPGKPIDRVLGGVESHSYRLPLEADDFVSLRIWQPSLDVKARLVGPKGESIPVFNDPGILEEPDRLAWIVTNPGLYRLVVQPRDPAKSGRYRAELRELREAGSGEADLVTAEHEYQEGRRLLWNSGPGSPGPAVLERFRKALSLWKEHGDVADQADALIQIANNFDSPQLIMDDALVLAQQAMDLAKDAGYREGEARALQAVGNAFDRKGQRSDAIPFFQRSAQISRSLREDHQLGVSLYSLGWDQYQQSRYDQALHALAESREVLSRVGNLGQAARAVIAMSNVYNDQGETTKALERCEEAARLSQSLKPADAALDANVSFCLGTVHMKRGEWEGARKGFEDSLLFHVENKNFRVVARIRQALGSVYFNLGDSKAALSEYAQALEIIPAAEEKDLQARLLTNTGWIYHATGYPEKALIYYQRALPLHTEGNSSSGIALTRHNMGVAYISMRRPKEGLAFLGQALDLRTRDGEGAAQAATLLEMGTANQALGNYREAAEFFRRALARASQIESTGLQAECLFRWAGLENAEGQLEAALAKIKKSLDIVESVRSNVLSDKLKTAFLASKRAYYELYMDLLMRLEAQHPGQYREAALEASERARARGLLDLLAEGRIKVQQGIAPELRQQEIELVARLSDLRNQLGKAQEAGRAATLERQLDEAQRAMESLESRIRQDYGPYAEVRYPTPLGLKEIQRSLDDRTALLQYFTGKNGSYLFIVTRQGLESRALPSRDELASQVKAVRRVLQQPGRRQLGRYQALAGRLYSDLVGPAEDVLRSKSRLLVAPDGPLYLLPFEALLTETKAPIQSYRDLPYLLRRFAVSYTPSASVLHNLRAAKPAAARQESAKKFIGFADPVLAEAAPVDARASRDGGIIRAEGGGLERLTESGTEIRRIAALFPSQDVLLYTGPQATEDNIKNNPWLRAARQIDFATHGTLTEVRPELSSLELTRSREDGRLTVYEIFNLQLDADLVTLSACDTGLGQEVSGEGVVGMLRAFFYAGAKSLVVSLWPVSDRSTPNLMFDFYRFRGASDKTEALRRAKLAMIQSGRFAEPYYWAPFILSGEPR
jgi:CHAT domain-containing protein/Tfp pilus assembly protein PilF